MRPVCIGWTIRVFCILGLKSFIHTISFFVDVVVVVVVFVLKYLSLPTFTQVKDQSVTPHWISQASPPITFYPIVQALFHSREEKLESQVSCREACVTLIPTHFYAKLFLIEITIFQVKYIY